MAFYLFGVEHIHAKPFLLLNCKSKNGLFLVDNFFTNPLSNCFHPKKVDCFLNIFHHPCVCLIKSSVTDLFMF